MLGDVEMDKSVRQSPSFLYKAFLFFVPNPAMTVAWAMVAAFAIADLIWLRFSRLGFSPNTFYEIARAAMTLVMIALVPLLIHLRLSTDYSKMADFVRKCAYGLTLMVLSGTFILALVVVGILFEYLATSAAMPLRDPSLAAIDKMFGFDWIFFLKLANSFPKISEALVFAYWSTGPILLGTMLILCFRGDSGQLANFLAVLAVSSVCTGILMVIAPAAGAYVQYAPEHDSFSHFSPNAGMWHFQAFEALRQNSNPTIDFLKSEGLVTFPSFHTVLAIIITYAVRHLRLLFWPMLTLNALVIVSTIPEGGHYLVDVIAGIVVAFVSINVVSACTAWLEGYNSRRKQTAAAIVPN
jgi:membrane-associated phospholipid phosphatase